MRISLNNLTKSILAGISISIGCIAYLTVGGIIGAFLFSFGLLSILSFKWNLYTGKAGIVTSFSSLYITYLGNVIGCALAYFVFAKDLNIQPLLDVRMSYTWYQTLSLSTFCGFVMTASVHSEYKYQIPIVLLGIPLFILCGFLHCIADFFYYMYRPEYLIKSPNYIISVFGNLIGCNIWRLTFLNKN